MRVYGTCIMCGKESYVELTDEQYNAYQEYLSGRIYIQDALPDVSPAVREFLMSRSGHYCNDCQKMLFGDGDDAIKAA